MSYSRGTTIEIERYTTPFNAGAGANVGLRVEYLFTPSSFRHRGVVEIEQARRETLEQLGALPSTRER